MSKWLNYRARMLGIGLGCLAVFTSLLIIGTPAANADRLYLPPEGSVVTGLIKPTEVGPDVERPIRDRLR